MAQNWAGSHRYGAAEIVRVSDVEEIRAALRRSGRAHALGTRHSFTDLPDTAGVLIDVTGMEGPGVLDAHAATITVTAGTRYAAIVEQVDAAGFALANMGSLPHINVGGATQTATHGSGDTRGVLTTAVASLRYLDADGGLHVVTREDPDFAALAVGVGAFGIVVDLTLDLVPRYDARQDVYDGLTWEALACDLDAVTSFADSVSLFTRWDADVAVWAKRRIEPDTIIPERVLDATRSATLAPIGVGPHITELGTPGPWYLRMPHFRADAEPSRGDEIQSEYFVARAHASAAFAALRAIADRFTDELIVSEIRTTAADDLWLSPAQGRDSVAIHFTWENHAEGVRAAVAHVEAALTPFAPRPHWGKLHLFDRARLEAVVPQLAAARAVFERIDPDGRFVNDHLVRVGLREPR